MSFERPIHTMNWGVHFRGSKWKSASGVLKIYKSTERLQMSKWKGGLNFEDYLQWKVLPAATRNGWSL